MLFGKKEKVENKEQKKGEQTQQQQAQPAQPQVMQINLVDVVKQAGVQIKYEEIGSWLLTHKTPLFWCHDKGFSIVDKNFIEERDWLKKALGRMVKEIEEQRQQKAQQLQEQHSQILPQAKDSTKSEGTGYIG